jgi:hypothetical protein
MRQASERIPVPGIGPLGRGTGQKSLDMIEAMRRIVDGGFVGHYHRHQPATDRIFTNQRKHSLVQLSYSTLNTARAESIPLVKCSNVAWPVTSSRTRASNPLRVTRPIFIPKPRGSLGYGKRTKSNQAISSRAFAWWAIALGHAILFVCQIPIDNKLFGEIFYCLADQICMLGFGAHTHCTIMPELHFHHVMCF